MLSTNCLRDPKDVSHPPQKYPCIDFLVFDSLLSDASAFERGHSDINHLAIRYSLKVIPPVIRRNIDICGIFKFANAQSVVDYVPEISAYVREDEFKASFEYSTRHDTKL
jgi:hypothetical protein